MKTKDIILKESPNTEEETLEHCLTVIQAFLDMDDFERAYNYLNSFMSEIISQTREETIKEQFPYSVSEWANVGKERGYWDYFRQEVIKEVEKMLPEKSNLQSASEYWSGFNSCLNQIKTSLNKLK